jgi:hypothetical protein
MLWPVRSAPVYRVILYPVALMTVDRERMVVMVGIAKCMVDVMGFGLGVLCCVFRLRLVLRMESRLL